MISNVSGYEPYDRMKAVGGSIMWPKNYSIPPGSGDGGALLGYVRFFLSYEKNISIFDSFLYLQIEILIKILGFDLILGLAGRKSYFSRFL